MADQIPSKTEGVHILRGPDGSVYMLSDTNLTQHRVSSELVPGLLKAFAPQGASGADLGAFKILATGKIPARRSVGLTPIDTWVDTM